MSIRKRPERTVDNTEVRDTPEVYMRGELSEPLTGSLTNELVRTQVGTILKEFSEKPLMSYVQALGRAPSLNIGRQNQRDRIENEKNFREFISDYDIDTPDILGDEDNYVEFERLDGEDLNDYINENPEEAEHYGREVADFVNYVHENDGAITDLRINNFRVQDSEDLAVLDAEYFVEDANIWEKEMDVITLLSSLKQVDPEPYESFRSEFEEEYNGRADPFADAVSSVTSQIHAKYEKDENRIENAKDNTVFRYL